MQVNPAPRVFFDAPVFGEVGPPRPPGRALYYSYPEITTMGRLLREGGWDVRAIVVARKFYPNGLMAEYDMAQTKSWGFVMEINAVMSHTRPYLPLKVLWMDGTIGWHWPEELFLVQKSTSQYELAAKFKEQLTHDPIV